MAESTVSYHSSVPRIRKRYCVIDQEVHAGYSDILARFQCNTAVTGIQNMDINCFVFGHQTQQQKKAECAFPNSVRVQTVRQTYASKGESN